MCGITAVITLAGRSRPQWPPTSIQKENQKPGASATNGNSNIKDGRQQALRQQVDESLKYIAHRGPDYSGSWASHDGLIGS